MDGAFPLQDELTISASAFKARCLELMDRVNTGELRKVTVTKRDKPVAVMTAPPTVAPRPKLFENMRGMAVSPSRREDPEGWNLDEEKALMLGMSLEEYRQRP